MESMSGKIESYMKNSVSPELHAAKTKEAKDRAIDQIQKSESFLLLVFKREDDGVEMGMCGNLNPIAVLAALEAFPRIQDQLTIQLVKGIADNSSI